MGEVRHRKFTFILGDKENSMEKKDSSFRYASFGMTLL